MTSLNRRQALALGSTALLLPSAARAQAWPSGPVTFVVGYAAGGSTDINARELAQVMTPVIGQQIIIDNKGGAAGSIGLRAVAAAKPDGQTLFVAVGTNVIINPHVQKGMIDTLASLAPICQVTDYQYVLVVGNKVPANTAAELVALAKKDPDSLTFSSSGVGGNNHLAGALFAKAAGIKMTHVPYKGTQLSITDLVAGQVSLLFDSTITGKPHIEQGRLKGLAVSSRKRSSILPDIPTVDESGLPGFDSWNYFGIWGPAGLPPAVVQRVNAEMNKILADPAVKARFLSLGFEITGGTPEQFAEVIASESRRWGQVIKDANIKPE